VTQFILTYTINSASSFYMLVSNITELRCLSMFTTVMITEHFTDIYAHSLGIVEVVSG
jgi:hypothetical protein